MTRILAFSDIHGSVPAVEALAESETPNFDAVLIAGDIGPGPTAFFRALESLDCPVLYVYGNWDYGLAYSYVFNKRSVHLHGKTVSIGELQFVGFSGCDSQWGQNPLWRALSTEVEHEHRAVRERLAIAEEADGRARAKIQRDRAEELADLANRVRDKRRRSYRARIVAITRRWDALLDRKCGRAQRVRETRAFSAYVAGWRVARKEAGVRNRLEVVERVRKSHCDPSRVVLVSHARLYRLPEEVHGLGAHLFGHRHGFKLSKQHGTVFANVSALDPHVAFGAQYGVIEWTPSSGFTITKKQLPRTEDLWLRCMDYKRSDCSEQEPAELVLPIAPSPYS